MIDSIRKVLYPLAGFASILITYGLAYRAYFFAYYTPGGTMLDGLGRLTFISPWLMQLLRIPLWPGWLWFVFDLAIFILGNYLGFKLIIYTKKTRSSKHVTFL